MHALLLLVLIGATFWILFAINGAKNDIIQAVREARYDSSRAKQMTDDLRQSAEPLAKAVEDNKPFPS